MCNGLIRVTVIICRAPFFSNSIGAKILGFPVVFRKLRARRLRIVGPYVSGTKMRNPSENPAIIKPTQNAHLQLTVDTNPDIIGADRGPKTVACWTQYRNPLERCTSSQP